jgi:DNA-binding transcriptional regulator GbsR (MarR family)
MSDEKMNEVMREVLDSLAKIGKQWGIGESVGRVWGFLLFKSCPVTQREIEEGTGYSRGLVSRSLAHLKKGPMIKVEREGREIRYSVNTSLTDSFGELLKRFLAENIKPMIELLSTSRDKIGDAKVKDTFAAVLHEYRKLNLAVLLFSRIMDDINTMPAEVENVEEAAKRISMKIML